LLDGQLELAAFTKIGYDPSLLSFEMIPSPAWRDGRFGGRLKHSHGVPNGIQSNVEVV